MLSAKTTSITMKQLSSEVTRMTEPTIYEKLSMIQYELKAPKSQWNKFGKYCYRNCEDILEAVKPLCNKYKTALTVNDELKMIGDRYYVVATATITCWATKESISNTAYARESNEKKGMDESQITGSTSSYARKYALNGLFCIDDTKDADTDESKNEQEERAKKETQSSSDKKEDKERMKAINGVQKQIDILKNKWKTDVYSEVVSNYVISLNKVPTVDINKLTTAQLKVLENIYQGIIVNKEKHAVADGNG